MTIGGYKRSVFAQREDHQTILRSFFPFVLLFKHSLNMFFFRFSTVAAAVLFVGLAQAAPLLATDPGKDSIVRSQSSILINLINVVSACGPSNVGNQNLGASCQFTSNGSPVVSGSKYLFY